MMNKQKKEVVQECFQLMKSGLQQLEDAESRLKDCGITFCSFKFPGDICTPEFQIQVYKGINTLAECLEENVHNPYKCGEPELNKLVFEKDGFHFLQLGNAGGYTFE